MKTRFLSGVPYTIPRRLISTKPVGREGYSHPRDIGRSRLPSGKDEAKFGECSLKPDPTAERMDRDEPLRSLEELARQVRRRAGVRNTALSASPPEYSGGGYGRQGLS